MKLSQPFCFCSCNHLIHKRGAKTSRFPKEDGVTRLHEMAQRMNPPPKTSAGDAEQVQPDQGFKIDSPGTNIFGLVVILHMFFKDYFTIIFFFKKVFWKIMVSSHHKYETFRHEPWWELWNWFELVVLWIVFFKTYLKKLNDFLN